MMKTEPIRRGTYDLEPAELPRAPLPFPAQGAPCPKCGHTGHMVWRPAFAHCYFCGFVKERPPVEAMPMTDDLRDVRMGTCS